MRNILEKSRIRQTGFTLIEVLIALAIFSLVGTGAFVMVDQLFIQNAHANQDTRAISQVENAAYWINQDALMAQTITPGAGSGFPLTLSWQVTDVNNDQIVYQVVYSLSGNSLERSYSVTGGTTSQTTVANYINSATANTNCSYDAASGVLTFQVTATIGTTSETRIYHVKPRVDQPST